ncbi:hypothetical protein OH76DRAFT_767606 [Lentinus brumalis]|uniref:Uncharacterized protein n=1 Tax=Lentinus brumalis TaxID=2498619 RepID=A0A371D4M4_9APHY|nr:hypothetical protein OH76DRAFT_767606 [Polyporus brumalis]
MSNRNVCGELARPQNDEEHTAAGSKCGCPATQPLRFGCALWHLATPSHPTTAPEASFLASVYLREQEHVGLTAACSANGALKPPRGYSPSPISR